ncbi:Hypothetical predicted protein [Xyrichtys novacula]|uniref:Uncharacterized protein n=1 Tax=Xyrichtys novacula TaxID=13765 RepID=A0AAV1F7D2_XYRNO|nr:Hypothetical predicted protein [Xyrichtys novacula]
MACLLPMTFKSRADSSPHVCTFTCFICKINSHNSIFWLVFQQLRPNPRGSHLPKRLREKLEEAKRKKGGGAGVGVCFTAEIWGSQRRHAEPIIVSLTLSN